MSNRRSISVFNMSFLDLMTNFLGAVMVLFLLAMVDQGKAPSKGFVKPGFFAFVSLDPTGNMIFGQVAPTMKPIGVGDTILVVVSNLGSMPIAGTTAPNPGKGPGRSTASGTNRGNEQQKTNQCAIAGAVKPDPCNPQGTTALATDDTYTAKVTVVKVGECGSTWRDNLGNTGAYGTAKTIGPFPIGQAPELQVADVSDPTIYTTLTVVPPAPCPGAAPIAAVQSDSTKGPVPPIEYGLVNFVATWGEATNSVNLYVRRQNGSWIPKTGNNDGRWGDYAVKKQGEWLKKQVGEVFYQDKVSPGIYEVWIQNLSEKTASRNVSFWVSSKQFPGTNISGKASIPYSKNSPKDGGGKRVAVVEVTAAGRIVRH